MLHEGNLPPAEAVGERVYGMHSQRDANMGWRRDENPWGALGSSGWSRLRGDIRAHSLKHSAHVSRMSSDSTDDPVRKSSSAVSQILPMSPEGQQHTADNAAHGRLRMRRTEQSNEFSQVVLVDV